MDTPQMETPRTGHPKLGPYLVVQVGEGLLLPIQKDLAGWFPHPKDAQRVNGDLSGLSAGMEDGGGKDVLQEGTE